MHVHMPACMRGSPALLLVGFKLPIAGNNIQSIERFTVEQRHVSIHLSRPRTTASRNRPRRDCAWNEGPLTIRPGRTGEDTSEKPVDNDSTDDLATLKRKFFFFFLVYRYLCSPYGSAPLVRLRLLAPDYILAR